MQKSTDTSQWRISRELITVVEVTTQLASESEVDKIFSSQYDRFWTQSVDSQLFVYISLRYEESTILIYYSAHMNLCFFLDQLTNIGACLWQTNPRPESGRNEREFSDAAAWN